MDLYVRARSCFKRPVRVPSPSLLRRSVGEKTEGREGGVLNVHSPSPLTSLFFF